MIASSFAGPEDLDRLAPLEIADEAPNQPQRSSTGAPALSHLEALPKARHMQSGAWVGCCPAHEDRSPSLSWTTGSDGRVLVKCHAGCETEAIVAALGLTMADLFAESSRPIRLVTAKPAAGPNVRARRYRVTDTAGATWTHVRREDASGRKVGNVVWQPSGVRLETLRPYGSELVAGWTDPIIVVEGEATADALRAFGVNAVGTFGTSYQPEAAALADLAGRRVIVWPDADPKGRAHGLDIAARLDGLAATVEWIEPPRDVFPGWDGADADHETVAGLIAAAGPLSIDSGAWLAPEDRGAATLSALGDVEYVGDLIRPGRIIVVAAEEGTGKSYAITGELGIRIAVAGGSFAGTWPILRTGPVLALSEMHADDDYTREETILAALSLERASLAGKYYRLPLMQAAGGPPALTIAPWRAWITGWLREHEALVLIVDTATGATQVDPWGREIQAVYAGLRAMVDDYPDLAIVLCLHLKKPTGRGERRLSDVLGEWGRWNDVTVMLEGDGPRTKITTHKRVKLPRRIVATKRDGLLVDPVDITAGKPPKVPIDEVAAAIAADPGLSIRALGAALNVSTTTATKYARAAEEAALVYRVELGNGRGFRLYPAETVQSGVDTPPPTVQSPSSVRNGRSLDGVGEGSEEGTVHPSTHPVGVDGPLLDTPPSDPIDGSEDYPVSATDANAPESFL